MEFSYIRDLTHNYMVACPQGEGEDYALRMALTRKIEGLLPVEARMINDELFLYYQTDSLLSLENKSLVQRPGRQALKDLFLSLLRMEHLLRDYLIGVDCLYLSPETVFTNPADDSWHFICMPFPHRQGTLDTFCESLLSVLDPEDRDAIADAYRICERTQEGNVRLRDLVCLLTEGDEEEEADEYTQDTSYRKPGRNASGRLPEGVAVNMRHEGGQRDEGREYDGLPDDDDAASDPPPGARDDGKKRNLSVRPGIFTLLFTAVLFADLYIRKNHILTGAGNILSLVVGAVCLAGAVGALVYGRRMKLPQDDFSDAGWTDAGSYDLWDDLYERDDAEPAYEDAVYADDDDADEPEETVLLSYSKNRRTPKLYGRNSVNNCNIALDRLPLTLGKLAGRVDLQLRDRSVSRVHAHINRDDNGGIVVKDMNSTNGTFLNGIRLRPNESVRIRTGDEICFGNMVFEYL